MSIANIIILSVPWRDVSRETVYRFSTDFTGLLLLLKKASVFIVTLIAFKSTATTKFQ